MPEILTESFCERCGTRYTFEATAPRIGRLTKFKIFSKGLRNYVLSDETTLDEALADARSEEDRQASTEQLDAFHKTFNFCMSCRQYTCGNCWNEVEGRCLTCAPNLSHDILDAPFPMLDSMSGTITPMVERAGNGHGVDTVSIAPLEWPTSDVADAEGDGNGFADVEELDAAATAARLEALLGHHAEAAVADTDNAEVAEAAADTGAAAAEPVEAAADLPAAEAVEDVHVGAADVEPEPELVSVAAGETAEDDVAPDLELDAAVADAATPMADAGTSVAAEAETAVPAAAELAGQPEEQADAALTEDELIEIQASLAAGPSNGRSPAHRTVEHGPAELPADDVAGRAAAAAAQTADLLARFRPTGAEDDVTLTEETLSAQEDDAFEEPVSLSERLAGAPIEHVEHGPSAAVQPVAEPDAEPHPIREAEAAAPGVAAKDVAEAEAAGPDVAAPRVVAAQPAPAEPVGERIAAEQTAPAAAAAHPAAESPAVTEPAPRDDRVEQPTWRIVAPDTDAAVPGDTGLPVQPGQPMWTQASAPAAPLQPQPPVPQPPAAPGQPPQWPARQQSAEPSWPNAPAWPSQPARGLARGAEAVWAASNRDVLSQPESGVQACVNCGLALSATARFCRRCGTSQVHA